MLDAQALAMIGLYEELEHPAHSPGCWKCDLSRKVAEGLARWAVEHGGTRAMEAIAEERRRRSERAALH